MHNRCLDLAVLAAVAFVTNISVAAEPVLFQAEAKETITVTLDPETSAARTIQTNVNFHKLHLYLEGGEREFIARETITHNTLDSTDGETASAKVELHYKKPDGIFSAKADHSTFVDQASEVEFKSDHWTATIFNCCDAETFTQLFAYGDSKPFLQSNSKYAQVILPNAEMNRYVGVVLRVQTPTEEAEKTIFGNNNKALAVILYAAPGKPLQKLFLQPAEGKKEDDFPYHTMDVDLKSASSKDEDSYNEDLAISKVLTMWSQDTQPGQNRPETISGLTIIANFSGNEGDTETVSIPVVNDKFGKAKITGGNMRALSGN